MIPNISLKGLYWEGNLHLDNWNEFYGKDLILILNIGGDCSLEELNQIHNTGYLYLISHQEEILELIFKTVFQNYSSWQDEYGYYKEEKRLYMPDITSSNELKNLMCPEMVFIMDIDKDDMPYIGVQFSCKWDDEHGVGIMLHKNRVVKVGGADTAFMSWIAKKDKECI